MLEDGQTVQATVRGGFHETGDYPKVGDRVRLSAVTASEESQAVIEEVLPRTSAIARLDQETRQPQILVTNVDVVFIVMGLDGDFNPKRLERYLALAGQSGIQPVILLNKADLATDLEEKLQQVARIAGTVPVHVITATAGAGLEALRAYLTEEKTAVLLGSSGAGKSTITNWLLGRQEQTTGTVRLDDSRGRHTTTTRQLFTLPTGGFLIDTPGMRELGLVEAEHLSDETTIYQVEQIAEQCKFRNCDHEKSAGCAVLAAVAAGEITLSTLENYYKLKREQAWLADKTGGKGQFKEQTKKRSAQARAAAARKRLSQGG